MKIVTNFHDKKNIYARNLKQVLNQGLVLKEVHKAIKFNQKVSYSNMNTELRKDVKNMIFKIFPSR